MMASDESTIVADQQQRDDWSEAAMGPMIDRLHSLRAEMLGLEAESIELVDAIPEDRRRSARNLLHYIALRRHDIRSLQEQLVPRGLSSLGRCEGFVMANTEAVLSVLCRLSGAVPDVLPKDHVPIQFAEARDLLCQRSEALFGGKQNLPTIMVTMPSEAASDFELVRDLLQAGMAVMRINCAHDGPNAWLQMIENMRRAEAEVGKSCRVSMDLAGPKIRTGPIKSKFDAISLRKSDQLKLTNSDRPGRPRRMTTNGNVKSIARIGCSLPEVFQDVRRGDGVLFDDGKIAGVVEQVHEDHMIVKITRAKKKGQKLRALKGINFPDTELNLPALTDKDIEDLAFIAEHADIVNYSFVRQPNDLERLHHELNRLGHSQMPIILKIENPQSFENLPSLLLEAMRYSSLTGVMIARGDLAVECGWERLVEVQEEVLWMCEAAHIPAVWATQVLEGLAKKGLPTRAELTDAGAGARAECVMLNKGPNIVKAVDCLYDILSRMHEHQRKKRPLFRRLHVADRIASR